MSDLEFGVLSHFQFSVVQFWVFEFLSVDCRKLALWLLSLGLGLTPSFIVDCRKLALWLLSPGGLWLCGSGPGGPVAWWPWWLCWPCGSIWVLSFITVWVFWDNNFFYSDRKCCWVRKKNWVCEFCHILRFWVVTFRVFFLFFLTFRVLSDLEFCLIFSLQLSNFEFLSFVTFSVFALSHSEFCHIFSFWVLSQFEFLSSVTFWVLNCHNLSFVAFWVTSHLEF